MSWFTKLVVLLTCIACNVLGSTASVVSSSYMTPSTKMMNSSHMMYSSQVNKSWSSNVIQATPAMTKSHMAVASTVTSVRVDKEGVSSTNLTQGTMMPSNVSSPVTRKSVTTPDSSAGFIVPSKFNLMGLAFSSLVFYLFWTNRFFDKYCDTWHPCFNFNLNLIWGIG